MNNQEAIRILEYYEKQPQFFSGDAPAMNAFGIAIEALRKQMPKGTVNDGAFGKCHRCDYVFNSELLSEYEINYCPNCGQAIDWGNEDE